MKHGLEYSLCPLEKTLRMIVGKWKTILIWHLGSGKKRYGELKKLVPKISEKMLIQSLRELEQHELVTRKVYPTIPPKVEYTLSRKGKSLAPLICALNTWGKKHL
ncbi:MAG: helix-turn-helix domain-containing protein [Candidatus Moranbacteria bacterium]|nr:helix-turn-helix domain-containing protein [Candidatus Moranbacteria bacterium]MDD3964579.1 helix-turn-helix domain-containing protein [Candidatus Moranbacteria bacterium]